jgi:hypothetical protein
VPPLCIKKAIRLAVSTASVSLQHCSLNLYLFSIRKRKKSRKKLNHAKNQGDVFNFKKEKGSYVIMTMIFMGEEL